MTASSRTTALTGTELVELMVDTVCSNREMIRIAGDDYPAEVVKSRFLKLNSSHIEYVLDRMRENTTYVRNIKKYLLAALYNAPATIDSYYTSLVSHDMYGGGDRRGCACRKKSPRAWFPFRWRPAR